MTWVTSTTKDGAFAGLRELVDLIVDVAVDPLELLLGKDNGHQVHLLAAHIDVPCFVVLCKKSALSHASYEHKAKRRRWGKNNAIWQKTEQNEQIKANGTTSTTNYNYANEANRRHSNARQTKQQK